MGAPAGLVLAPEAGRDWRPGEWLSRVTYFVKNKAHHLRLRLRERDGDLCWICGKAMVFGTRKNKPDVASIDHIVPKVHGGPTTMANLKLAHRLCNNRRGSPAPVKQEAAAPVESA